MSTSEMHNNFDEISHEDFVIATYSIGVDKDDDVQTKTDLITKFIFPGTGVQVAGDTPKRKEMHSGRVLNIYEAPQYEIQVPVGKENRNYIVQIGVPVINIGESLTMLLTITAGEILAFGNIKLLDLYFPRGFISNYHGPKFGVEGIRQTLDVYERPLLLAIYKPSLGYSPNEGAKNFYEVAVGGADLVKDDELLSDPSFCRRLERVKQYTEAEKRAFEETGEHTLYAVNITDNVDQLVKNALDVIELGANALMINYLQVGLDAARMVCEDPRITIPVLGHNSGATSFYANHNSGMSATLINAKLPRICGVDLCIFFTNYGKFPTLRERSKLIFKEMLRSLNDIHATFPIAAGGITPGLVDKLYSDFGQDIVLGSGGCIFGHPQGPKAGATAFRQAIESSVEGRDLTQAADEHEELKVALETWGVQ